MNRLTSNKKATVIQLYKEGRTTSEICEQTRISLSAIYKYLEEAGLHQYRNKKYTNLIEAPTVDTSTTNEQNDLLELINRLQDENLQLKLKLADMAMKMADMATVIMEKK